MPMDTPQHPLPLHVAWLGYGGLLPFVVLAALVWLHAPLAAWALQAQLAYGAVILSFVGALHWGLAVWSPQLPDGARAGRYVWSVVPALLAWVALLLPALPAAVLLCAGFVLHYGQDLRHARAASPRWYLPLRARLTAVATLCLLVSALPALGG
jgi:hypothetical protein